MSVTDASLYHVSGSSNEAELWRHVWRQSLSGRDDASRCVDAEETVGPVQIVRHLSVQTFVRVQRRNSDHKRTCHKNRNEMKQTKYEKALGKCTGKVRSYKTCSLPSLSVRYFFLLETRASTVVLIPRSAQSSFLWQNRLLTNCRIVKCMAYFSTCFYFRKL